MRNPSKQSHASRSFLGRLFGKSSESLRKAPRRRDIERLERREMLSVNPTQNPYFEDQWHLNATGQLTEQPNSPTFLQSVATQDLNVLGAWNLGYTGAGVQVAVVDSAFDLNHEDLQFVLLTDTGTTLDLVDADNDPSYIDLTDGHGTSVAGLIGALDNTTGMIGIAHGADIIPVRFLPGTSDTTGSTLTGDERSALSFVQFAGIPDPGEDWTNSDQAVDIFNRSYGVPGRQTTPLNPLEAQALRDAAILGRGSWLDVNGNGVFEPEEIDALGSINIVAAGNSSGPGFTLPFDPIGLYESAQYGGLGNSRYTITVGSVDFGGNYKNPETGSRGSWAETGANVLVVAPTQTFGIDIGQDEDLIGGVWTTDLTGDDGYNSAPVFGQNLDGDFFVDTNYTSTFGGTSAAAPMVSGVVALMLEANPNLSYNDVQQILLMSAEQNDQFDESWIVNPYRYFEDTYVRPQYHYYNLDTTADGEVNVENAVIPNYVPGPNPTDPDVIRGFFRNNPDFDIAPPAEVDVTALVAVISGTALSDPDPILVWPPNTNVNSGSGAYIPGVFNLLAPASGVSKGIPVSTVNIDSSDFFGQPATRLVNGELQFENGAGFTVSWGYGDFLEEYGYAHGVVDAELAVQLAEAWGTYNQHLTQEVTLTTSIQGGTAPIRVQPMAEIGIPDTSTDYEVPGGISTDDINSAFYAEFFRGVTHSNIQDANGVDIGSVITDAPFYNPDGSNNVDPSDRGDSRISFRIDPSTTTDFLSLQWLEFTTQVVSGDVDSLRMSIISPDGTQTELNPYRRPVDPEGDLHQTLQDGQGLQAPGGEIVGEDIGAFTIDGVIDGSEQDQIGSINLDDAVPAGSSWTWTTNRHWGELFSTEAQNFDNPNASVEGQWYLVLENWGEGAVELGGQYEFALHGTQATGNRIQGKLGVDDNKQGREDQDTDELFNFDRNMKFGQLFIDAAGTLPDIELAPTFQVVLDDATDAVSYKNNYYETVDDSTGQVFRYAVVDQAEYLALAEILQGAMLAPGQDPSLHAPTEVLISEAEALAWYIDHGAGLGLNIDPSGDGMTNGTDALLWQTDLAGRMFADLEAAENFEPQLNYGLVNGTSVFATTIDEFGNALTYQNFDFNQETFASNVTVQATQYRVDYDAAGNIVGRTSTGVIDYFTTGADGNYFFDIEANPEPPNPANFQTTAGYDAAYAQWLIDFGSVFEYEISLVGDSALQNRIIDNDYSSSDIAVASGSSDYQSGMLKYNVPIFASPEHINGQVTVIDDVNFLLEVDPAKTNVAVSGSVYRDQDGDNNFDATESGVSGVVVYHDADGNGVLDAGEAQATVAADGSYSFTVSGLTSAQSITLAIDTATIPVDLELLNPITGIQSINVTPGIAAAADFTLQKLGGEPALVQGVVFEDVNQNAIFDTGTEFGLGLSNSVRVYIDVDGDGVFDDDGTEPNSMTLADGTFAIESETEGTFDIRVDLDTTPLTQTLPTNNGGISTVVSTTQVASGLEFGLFDARNQDFGDLSGYPTLLSQNGARHIVVDGVFLGSRVDIEGDGQPTADARGDDTNGVNDDDGVVLLSTIVPSSTMDLEITPHGQGASLNAWIDFNNDGDWDDAGEQIFVDAGLVLGQKNLLSVATPADVDTTATALAARFRWGPFGISYDGPANAGEVEDYLLPLAQPINISGEVRLDADGDTVFDAPGDTPQENVVVYYDANLDGVRQVDELSSLTNAAGEYQIAINATSSVDVTLRIDETSLTSGLEFIIPVDGIFSQTVAPGSTISANFLVGFPQGVAGNVFQDDNNNATKDGVEGGKSGITVNLYSDTDTDGTYETLVGTTTTDVSGDYNIPTATAGMYEVRLDLSGLEFHTQTLPGSGGRVVTVAAGVVNSVADFGVHDATVTFTDDYGDLFVDGSHTYPTTLADNGARHTVVAGVFLGTGVDADPGTLTSTTATADDNSLTDDEDGVVLVSTSIVADSTIEIDITATGVGGETIDAWIDFNDDGDWDDAGEQIAVNVALVSGATTRLIAATPTDVSGSASLLAARFRWGAGALAYAGAAASGEVEDYLLPTVNPGTGGGVEGDYDGNGTVNDADRTAWAQNYGSTTNLAADGNGNGVVDAPDYTIWRDAYEAAMSAPAMAMASGSGPDYTIDLTQPTVAYATAAPSEAIPPVEQHPIVETEPEPVVTSPVVFAPVEVVVAPAESLSLNAAVLAGGTLDESFAMQETSGEERQDSAAEALDDALLLWDDSLLADRAEETSAVTLAEGEEEDEALAEAVGEALLAF